MLFSAAAGSSSKLGFHPIKCDIHPVESNFQTRSEAAGQGKANNLLKLKSDRYISLSFPYTKWRDLLCNLKKYAGKTMPEYTITY